MKDKVIALDIGGTYMRCAVVKENKIFRYEKVETPRDEKLFLKKIIELIKKYDSDNVNGIGVAIAGPVKNGVVENPPNLPIKNFDLKKYLFKHFKKRIEVKNDGVCSSLAELKFGGRKNNFILLTFGTGIGGGIIINGKEYSGEGAAGEFGHIYLEGKFFEDSWKNTRKRIIKNYNQLVSFDEFIKKNEKESNKILEEASDYIAKGIVSLINSFDPEEVIIRGCITKGGDKFLSLIKKKIKKYSFFEKTTQINYSELEHSGVIGAGLLVK